MYYYNEVLDILKHLDKRDVEKIPKDLIRFLKINSVKGCKKNLDFSKSMEENHLSKKARIILSYIFTKYIFTNDERMVMYEILMKNK